MRCYLPSLPTLLAVAGCAGAAGTRSHDAMVAALRDADRERPARIVDELALDAGPDRALDRAALVAAVLARNPELDAARETWRAAAAAYPPAVALADPMLTYEIAPLSIAGDIRLGQRVQLAQKLPYPGKRRLAGEAALADADAARADYATLRLQLAEAAVNAFDDYYVAARALEVNTHHRAMLEQVQRSASAQYAVGRGTQQDPLEADGEVIGLDRERLMLASQQRAAIARINRLLRRPPDAALPAPPARLEVATPSPATAALDPTAAARARARARSAELAVAELALYPDLEVMASYDAMFDDLQHRFTVGIAIELPLSRAGRRGSVERARAALAGAAAELTAVTDTLAEDRDRARRDVDEATAALELYVRRAVPNARARVDAALAGFTAGQTAFSAVVVAERALRELELAVERARGDLDRRVAAYDRLAGQIAGGAR